MPEAYSGTDTYPTSYDCPADTDKRNAASVRVPLEALGNRTTYLKNRVGVECIAEVDAVEVKTLSTLATSTATTYPGVAANPASYTLPTLTSIKAGDVVEIVGMVHVGNNVSGTTAYVRPAMISQPSSEVVVGSESIVVKADDPKPMPIFARLIVPEGTDTWVVPWLEVKTGTNNNGVSIISPSSLVVRVYRSVA